MVSVYTEMSLFFCESTDHQVIYTIESSIEHRKNVFTTLLSVVKSLFDILPIYPLFANILFEKVYIKFLIDPSSIIIKEL
jgi:hypothetical protein